MTVINTNEPQQPGGLLGNLFRIDWVFNARRDLVFLIGSVLAGWAVFGLSTVLTGDQMLMLWFVWVITLDTPHFFATYSRTYLDREFRQQQGGLLIWTLGVFLLGPVCLILAYSLYGLGSGLFQLPWSFFAIFVSLWAYWHITRQHYGIMRLYHRKSGETGTLDSRLDAWVLYGCLLVPFIALVGRHPSSRGRVDLEGAVPWFPAREDGQSFIGYFIDLRWEHQIIAMTIVVVAVLLTIFVGRQIQRVMRGEKLPLPKLLFMGAVLPLHIYICYSDQMLVTGLLTFTVIITIYHDLQYLAIVWFYNEKRYGGEPAEAKKRYGAAATISRRLWLWMGCAIAFSIPMWTLGCMINRIPVCATGPAVGSPTILGNTDWIIFFVLVTSGFQMHHYILDQYIWRPGKDKRLREDLKVDDLERDSSKIAS